MADTLLSDADVGLGGASPAPAINPAAQPDAPRPITIRPGPAPQPALLSDADVGLAPSDSAAAARQGAGPLANTQNDSWTSGAAKGAATAGIKGLSHIPGWVGDVDDLSTFLAAGAASLFDSRSASDIYKSMKAKVAAHDAALPTILRSPGSVLPNAGDVASPVLARTGEYQPTSEIGRLSQAGVEAAVGGLGPGAGGLTKGARLGASILSTVKQAPLNALAGAAGQGATDTTDNPYLGLAASLVAPGAAEAGWAGAVKVAAPFAEDVPLVGRAFSGTRDARVGRAIIDAADDPTKLRASVGLGADSAPAQPALPGSTPTLGQASGDLGILRAEEKARTADNIPFLERETDQNSARRAALAWATPDGDAMLPSQFLADRAALIDQAHDAAQQRILGHAQALAASLGPGQGAEVNGAAVRGALDQINAADAARDAASVGQARAATAPLGAGNAPELNGQTLRAAQEAAKARARQMRSDLYAPATLDPNGDLALVTSPIAAAGRSVADDLDPLGAPPSADVSRILAKAQNLPAVLPYKSVMALDQDITTAMAKERRANGETPDWHRLGQLKSGMMSTIHDALDNQHAYEQSAVATGRMGPEDTTMSRLKGAWEHPDDDVGRTAGDQSRATGTSDAGGQTGGQTADPGADGAGGSSSRPPRQGVGDQGIPTQERSGDGLNASRFDAPPYDPDATTGRVPQRPDVPRPQSLEAFVRLRGGMTDPGGDLAAMGLHKLIGKAGAIDPDKMREAAAEAGYLGGDTARVVRETTPADLFDALENGSRTYSVHDHDAVLAWDDHDQGRAAYDRAKGGDPAARAAGPRPKAPLSSYGVDDIYPPGMAPEPPGPANGALRPNADEGFADRLRAAKAAHAEYAQTFKQGTVGEDLRTNGFAGQYRTGSGALAGKLLPAGPGGYDVMRARLAAVGNDPSALAALRDQALAPLRAKLDDGMLPQSAIDAWRLKHDGALRALDEAIPGFSRSLDPAGAAHAAVLEARAAADAGSITGRYAGTPAQTITRAIKAGPEGYERLKTLLNATRNDPAVIGAVKDQIVDPLRRSLLLDGTVAPKAHAAWAGSFGPALRALDEASPGFSKGVADAAAATDILQRAGAVRQRTADALQANAASKLLGKTSPDEVGATLLGIVDDAKAGPTKARQVREALEADPDALAGAQKAVMDAIARRYVNTAESGTSGEKSIASAGLQRFVANRNAALRELLPAHSVNTLQAIAADLERANRDVTGTRIRGTSQTAKNQHGMLAGMASGHAGHTALGVAITEGLLQAYEHGGLHGAALAAVPLAGGLALTRMRASGTSKERAMFRDALLNPDRARHYLSKVPAGEAVTPYHVIANMLRRELVTTPIVRQAYGR